MPARTQPFIAAALAAAGVAAAIASAQQSAQPAADATIRELLTERRDVLAQRVELLERLHEQGAIDYERLFSARDQLLEAELELATDKSERIALLGQRVEQMRTLEELLESRFGGGQVTETAALEATAARLQAQIELMRERVLPLDPDQPSAQSPDPLSKSSAAKGGSLRFSETHELVLANGSMDYMLDLDTGRTMDPPATIGRSVQAQMDVRTDQIQPYHYPVHLIGRGLQGVEVKATEWDASAEDVRRAIAGDAVGPLKTMDCGPTENPTYFFITRGGAVGVLQLLGIVHEPKGIRLRYKRVEREPRIESAPSGR